MYTLRVYARQDRLKYLRVGQINGSPETVFRLASQVSRAMADGRRPTLIVVWKMLLARHLEQFLNIVLKLLKACAVSYL